MQGQTVGGGCWGDPQVLGKSGQGAAGTGKDPGMWRLSDGSQLGLRGNGRELMHPLLPAEPVEWPLCLSPDPPPTPRLLVFSASPSPHRLQAPPARSLVFLRQLSSRFPSPPSLWERWDGGKA